MASLLTLPSGAQRGAVEERFDPESWQSPASDFWHSIFSDAHPGLLPPWMGVDESVLAAAGVVAFDGGAALARGGGRPGSGGSGGGSTVTDSYLSGSAELTDDGAEYNLQIDFLGELWTDDLKQDFITAADYLSRQVIGDLPDITSQTLFGGTVDDIVITANLINIDGTGNVLGRAGPTYIRTSDGLPVAGTMEFDVADAAYFDSLGLGTNDDLSLWYDIVQHEMLHTLGFGTLWDGLVTTTIDTKGTKRPSDDTVDYRFTGETAMALADASLYADPRLGIPVETDGGSGTAGGHWDDATFGNELMTGYIDDANYIAPMTIGVLQDLGYTTIYA